VPALWKLRHVRRSRIFQRLSVPEIVSSVLGDGGVEHRVSLNATYRTREYCVQYGESDLDFVSRLLEDEGIFYYFEHEPGRHTLVLADAVGACAPLPGDKVLPFREPSAMPAESEYVDAFSSSFEVCPAAVALRDFNYLSPAVDLGVRVQGEGDGHLELYEFPGGYEDGGTGKALAKVRLEEARVRARTAAGSSFSRRLSSGSVFDLADHPVDDLDGGYLVLAVRHRGHQPEVLPHSAVHDGKQERYRNDFECIRTDVPFRPERRTARPFIPGPQTAIVVGPPGEEIHCDEHGRVKVQFHWDREGGHDDRSSCWIRVSQAWAGPGWGALYLPRIGQEVVVEFLEGDPDRPIVTGAVYNGMNPPPLSLPADKTQSTLRSASSPGSDGSNELRFEDAAGQEEVYLHAQRDLSVAVENDRTESVGGNDQLTVQKDRRREVGGNQTLAVQKNDTSTVGGDQSLGVGASRTVTVGGSHTETVGADQSVTVGGVLNVTVAMAATESIGLGKVLSVGGAYAVNVGGAMNELVGGLKSEEIAGAKVEVIGAKKTESVAGSRTMSVGGDLSETVGGKRTLKVSSSLLVNVAGQLTQTTTDRHTLKAKEIVLSADDRILVKVGSATLEMKKGGDVILKGAKVEVKASGDIVLKASKISEN
jgi:type VI secretion system secreted protein VgrG